MEIHLEFNRAAQNIDEARSVFQENASQIISEARNLSGDYEKEKFVHDKVTEWVSYDSGAEMNQSAYSALVNGRTVCAGYARRRLSRTHGAFGRLRSRSKGTEWHSDFLFSITKAVESKS